MQSAAFSSRPHCDEPRLTALRPLGQVQADLLSAGYAVDDQTLESAQRFLSGQIAWKDFLLQSNFDNVPSHAWDEWAR